MVNPSPQRLVLPHCASNGQPEISCICVYKARADSAVPSVAVDKRQRFGAGLPGLSHNCVEHSVEDDLGRVVSVKIDFHDERRLFSVSHPRIEKPAKNEGLVAAVGLEPTTYGL